MGKVGFLVIDFTWKIFSQTGNIETYLLLKELEKELDTGELDENGKSETATMNTNM